MLKMSIINECSKVMSSSDADKIVKYEISNSEVQNETFKNLKTNFCSSKSDCSNTDSISRYESYDEYSSLNNANYILREKNKKSDVNYIDKPELFEVNTFVTNNSCIKTNLNLDDALNNCINEMDNDFLDELIEFNKNDSTLQMNSNLLKDKKNILLSNECNSDYNIDNNRSYYNINNIISIKEINSSHINNITKLKPKFHHEIAVGIPNIFIDQSSEVDHCKKTLERFLQKDICLNLPSKISKCIECNFFQMKKNLTKHDYDNITCRFYAFRQLRFTKNGKLSVAGYLDPNKNLDNIDLGMWLPGNHSSLPSDLNIQASKKILEDAGGQFCQFVRNEKEALKLNWPNDHKRRKVVWKKCVKGIREMCDVCKTTIFNHHWSCGKCGFVVCVDCYKSELEGDLFTIPTTVKYRNNKKVWLHCSDQEKHEVSQLVITQILAGNALDIISKLMHNTCIIHGIPLNCNCNKTIEHFKTPVLTDFVTDMFLNDKYECCHDTVDNEDILNMRVLLTKNYFEYNHSISEAEENKSRNNYNIISKQDEIKNLNQTTYTRKKEVFAPKLSIIPNDETITTPHTWLCEGHLLHLLDPISDANYELFQDQWKRGQPVLVSDVGKNLDSSLWCPESFSRDFGNQKNDLINFVTGKIITDQPMCTFWDGFKNAALRLRDQRGDAMLLKLKDWPPSADFAEILPDRFRDLMNGLPLKEYTHRNGRFNLASRLPECFVRPDLGPKMYTAYGNAGSTDKKLGTTNLHLDVSDAVNVMVYVAVTENCENYDQDWYVDEALRVIHDAGCDELTMKRIYSHNILPGALWHIYHASDADSIRDLLIKVAIEKGKFLEPCSDPIHDQSNYLDEYLRDRLFKEYGVKGYAIVQCLGDAVFIPAGAPHQVRNLHNCIKVAEDFVSPENVENSFRMTQEFRNLTDSHANHEDKLQIKNIVFHAVKDSVSVLKHVK